MQLLNFDPFRISFSYHFHFPSLCLCVFHTQLLVSNSLEWSLNPKLYTRFATSSSSKMFILFVSPITDRFISLTYLDRRLLLLLFSLLLSSVLSHLYFPSLSFRSFRSFVAVSLLFTFISFLA